MTASRIVLPLKADFDHQNKQHAANLYAAIAKKYGDDYRIESINPHSNPKTATIVRVAAVNEVEEVREARGKAYKMTLNEKLRSKGAGKKVAVIGEEKWPGTYLWRFEPEAGRAIFKPMSVKELRARQALADALGCESWDVEVLEKRGGGFDVVLPYYRPKNKHQEKLQQAVEEVIGRFGWFIDIDPATLKAKVVPSDPPMFPEMLPVDLKNLGDGDVDRVPFAMALPGRGKQTGDELILDFTASAFALVAGTPGSGKCSHIGAKVMARRGMTTIGELVRGDEVVAADGSWTKVIGFSERQIDQGYRVTFDDGQSVIVGPQHQWLVSSRASRMRHGPRERKVRDAAYERDMAEVKRIREVLSTVKSGETGSLIDIARLLGYHDTALHPMNVPEEMANEASLMVMMGRPAPHYDTIMVNDYLFDHDIRCGTRAVRGPLSKCGQWANASTIASELFGVKQASVKQVAAVREALDGADVDVRVMPGQQSRRVTVYPVDEVLDWLATERERVAGTYGFSRIAQPLETLTDTVSMMGSVRVDADNRANYAVRVAPAYEGVETALRVDPWLLGVWLGGGFTSSDEIAVGKDEHEWMSAQTEIRRESIQKKQLRDGSPSHIHLVSFADMTNADLRAIDVLDNKHIPEDYFLANIDDRRALLAGIVDTDGYVAKDGSIEIALSDERLATDVLRLVRSLGIKASKTVSAAGYRKADGEHVTCKDRHRITFATNQPVARMPRKAERIRANDVSESRQWLYITDIEPVGEHTLRCVKVDHPTHLFMVGDSVLTHNSVTLNNIVSYSLANGADIVIVDDESKAVDYLWVKPWVRRGGWGCDSVRAAAAALALVYEEGRRRAKVLAEMGLNNWLDMKPEERFTPILCVVDEASALLVKVPESKDILPDHPIRIEQKNTNIAKDMLSSYMTKIMAEQRFVGVRMVVSTQAANNNTGVGPSMKAKMGNFILQGVAPSKAARSQVFPDETAVPTVPEHIQAAGKRARGVGVGQLEGQAPVVYKSYFAPVGDFQKAFERLGLPRNGSAPTEAEIAKYIPSVEYEFGMNDDRLAAAERAPSGKSAAQVAAEMGDADGVAMHDGSMGTGYEKANAMRNRAAGGGQTRKQRAQARKDAAEDRANASRSGPVVTEMMARCNECGMPVNPMTKKCINGHQHG